MSQVVPAGTPLYGFNRSGYAPDRTLGFDMREAYTDLFAPMIFKSIPDLQPSFRRFADGLKLRVKGSP